MPFEGLRGAGVPVPHPAEGQSSSRMLLASHFWFGEAAQAGSARDCRWPRADRCCREHSVHKTRPVGRAAGEPAPQMLLSET